MSAPWFEEPEIEPMTSLERVCPRCWLIGNRFTECGNCAEGRSSQEVIEETIQWLEKFAEASHSAAAAISAMTGLSVDELQELGGLKDDS